MQQKLLPTFAVLSLVVCTLLVTAAGRSYFRSDFLYYSSRAGRIVGIDSGLGWAALTVERADPRFLIKGWSVSSQMKPAKPVFSNARNRWQQLGFWSMDVITSSSRGHRWVVPYWAVMLPFLVAPTAWILLMIRAARRARLTGCTRCGYDLRATPARCPECGTINGRQPLVD